jgi:hypothetical protein
METVAEPEFDYERRNVHRLSPSLFYSSSWEAVMRPAQVEDRSKPAKAAGRMKLGQWTAILVLALMVGGISFVSVYLGDSSRAQQDTGAVVTPSLDFPIKSFPREGEKVQTTEVEQVGHQDYWFVNGNEQDVLVGLNAKGCTCSEVELTLAPPSWMPYLARSVVTNMLPQPMPGLDILTILAVANDRDHQFLEMPDADGTLFIQNGLKTVTVPPGAVGRVRLSWKQHQVKPLHTYADLWIGQRGGNANVRLDAGVRISSPLEVNRELTIDPISERDLEKLQGEPDQKGRRGRGWIVCYSMTRPTFHLKAEVLHDRPQEAQSDPIEVGEPIPLEAEVLKRLTEGDKGEMHRLTVLSGYRIPVTVRARAKDGMPIEWGRFQRTVQLSSTDPGIEPVQVQVMGEVEGDVSIGINNEGGTINLGPFRRTHGIGNAINLETDEKSIDLELDQARNPKFLKVTLSEPQETAGHRSWVLRVKVPPNAARGEFPRPDNPDYRDSAIYVKTKGGKTGSSHRSIRVPVRGVANEG